MSGLRLIIISTLHLAKQASAVEMVGLNVGGNLRLPDVTVDQEFLLIVKQFLVSLRGKFEIWALRMTQRTLR